MLAGRHCRALFLALLAGSAAYPGLADVKAGVDAWTTGDFNTAVAEWQGPAAKGDPDAQFNMGQAYKLGRGVKQDLGKAESLFAKAAAKGHLQAADNFGLLLFQRGERKKALPYVTAAAERGDPRAQYLLGIAHFNGDEVPKDWVRAYALMSMAQQAGLPVAAQALAQMDENISLEQRQQSVALAQEMSAQAEATRARQLASVDLGSESAPGTATLPPVPVVASAPAPVEVAQNQAIGGAAEAGADFARPSVPATTVAVAPRPVPPAPRPVIETAVVPPKPAMVRPAPAAAPVAIATGPWRVQIGAFGVAANADAMWNRVKSRPEVAGRSKLLIPAGSVTKLMIGGYASQADAQSACSRLSAGGISCLVTR
jgi:uncharacterized protein